MRRPVAGALRRVVDMPGVEFFVHLIIARVDLASFVLPVSGAHQKTQGIMQGRYTGLSINAGSGSK